MRLFQDFFSPIKRNKGFFVVMLIATISVIVLAIFSAVNFDGGVLVLDFKNVTYIKYLKGDSGLMSFIFMTILMVAVFYALILLCCSKKFLLPFAILFYLYYVYAQIVYLVSLLLLYGFLNVLILFLFLIVYLVAEILLLLILLLSLLAISGDSTYFKTCFSPTNNILLTSIALLLLVLAFCIILMLLKTFVLILIF